MQRLFTSDLHLGHKNILKYRPGFTSTKEHDNFMIDKILSLPKRTLLTIVGDFIFDSDDFYDQIHRIEKARCQIQVVMGNHDSKKLYQLPNNISIELPIFSLKNMWVSHCPIHPGEMRGRIGNIHGHLHNEVVTTEKFISRYGGIIDEPVIVPDNRYFNVNIDVNQYEFVTLEQIKDLFSVNL